MGQHIGKCFPSMSVVSTSSAISRVNTLPLSPCAIWATSCGRFSVELHKLRCVTEPGDSFADVLLNPGNGVLSGINYPTFRRGCSDERGVMPGNWCVDPTVIETQTSADVFIGAASCVDGRVHSLGGQELKSALAGKRCDVGGIVHTESFGSLRGVYPRGILHTNSPSVNDSDCASLLRQCYEAALQRSFLEMNVDSLASVLVGTGVRGIDVHVGARCAMSGVCKFWAHESGKIVGNKVLRFALREEALLASVAGAFQEVKEDSFKRVF